VAPVVKDQAKVALPIVAPIAKEYAKTAAPIVAAIAKDQAKNIMQNPKTMEAIKQSIEPKVVVSL
jgi:hypothetical protein